MHRGYRHIVLAIGLIALLCAPALGQEGQPQGIGENEEAGEQAQEDRPGDTAVEDQIVSPVEAPQAEFAASDAEGDDQAAEQHQTQQPVFDWRTFVSAKDTLAQWIMAAFGVVATGVSVWAIILLRRTLRESRRATEAALKAAMAAEETIEVTKDIGQREIRAYIAVEGVGWGTIKKNDTVTGYNVTIKWKNCGTTPARRCYGRASREIFDGAMPVGFDFPDKTALSITEKNHVGPGQPIQYTVGDISRENAIAIERREKRLYVWSWVEYDDIFGRKRRRTEVCAEIELYKNGEVSQFKVVGPFNGADEDCHHKTKT